MKIFAISVWSATLLANTGPLTIGFIVGASLILPMVAVEVGSGDVWPCLKSRDVAFVESFVSVGSDGLIAAKNN